MPFTGEGLFSETLGNNSFLNIMKAMKMVRLFKLARQYAGAIVIMHALKESINALLVPFFFLMCIVIGCASFAYYVELQASGGLKEDGGNAAFESIPHAIWFMLVTMTTVGFGDVYPHTASAKFVTVFAMICGVLFIAMPIAIVGNTFCDVWEHKERVIFVEKFKDKFITTGSKNKYMSKKALEKIFAELDTDNSGTLSFGELVTVFRKMETGYQCHVTELRKLWKALDVSGTGAVHREEFFDLFRDDLDHKARRFTEAARQVEQEMEEQRSARISIVQEVAPSTRVVSFNGTDASTEANPILRQAEMSQTARLDALGEQQKHIIAAQEMLLRNQTTMAQQQDAMARQLTEILACIGKDSPSRSTARNLNAVSSSERSVAL